MKRHHFLGLAVLIFVGFIALVFLCDKVIVPKEATGQVKPLKFKPLKMMTATKDCLIYRVPALYQDMPTFKPPVPKWLKRFLFDYREYSAECYADSQHIETHPPAMGKEGQVLGVYIIRWVWIHRTPTLPGFMQFLEEKYK